jgi:hypothetical protein
MYVNYNTAAAPVIESLPLADPFFGIFLTATYSLGRIDLYCNVNLGTALNAQNVKVQQYRYILIPGGQAARKAPIDWKDYKAVQAYLGLKD